MSTSKGAETLDLNISTNTFVGVVFKYVSFLHLICDRIVRANDVEMHKRKFDAVKEELFDYLVEHSDYFNMKYINTILKDGTSGSMIIFYYSRSSKQFLSLDYFLRYFDTYLKLKNTKKLFQYKTCVSIEKDEIINKVKHVLKKQNISNCDLKMFFEKHYLVSKTNSKSKFNDYKEISSFIGDRVSNYRSNIVSTKRINRLSFKFQGSITNYEDQKSCGICTVDYKKNRLVCHLPCNHFYHTSCLKKWFITSFQCPFCRNDCI